MEHICRNEAIKVITTLINFILQNEKCTPDIFKVLQKIRDEIHVNINFSKKQTTLYSYFDNV